MIETLRRFVAALALAGISCSGGVGPPPPGPPEPPPADPSPVCVPPGLVVACWHMPAGEWLYIPAPVVDALDCDGPVAEPALAVSTEHGAAVNAAILRAYGCDGGRCVVHASRFTVMRRIVDELRGAGLCAGQNQPGTDAEHYGSDEIAVSTSRTAKREGYHVAAGAAAGPMTLVLSPQAARPAYMPAGGVTPAPGPVPTPTPAPTPGPVPAGCSAPLPPKLWTAETLPDGWGQDEIGRPRWVIDCSAHGRVVDCTAKVAPRACDYCASIGMGEMGGQIRCGCPVRNECPGFKCEERGACEAYLTGGTKLEARNGATCSFARGNPFQFEPNDGNCRLCSVGDPRVCGGWN